MKFSQNEKKKEKKRLRALMMWRWSAPIMVEIACAVVRRALFDWEEARDPLCAYAMAWCDGQGEREYSSTTVQVQNEIFIRA